MPVPTRRFVLPLLLVVAGACASGPALAHDARVRVLNETAEPMFSTQALSAVHGEWKPQQRCPNYCPEEPCARAGGVCTIPSNSSFEYLLVDNLVAQAEGTLDYDVFGIDLYVFDGEPYSGLKGYCGGEDGEESSTWGPNGRYSCLASHGPTSDDPGSFTFRIGYAYAPEVGLYRSKPFRVTIGGIDYRVTPIVVVDRVGQQRLVDVVYDFEGGDEVPFSLAAVGVPLAGLTLAVQADGPPRSGGPDEEPARLTLDWIDSDRLTISGFTWAGAAIPRTNFRLDGTTGDGYYPGQVAALPSSHRAITPSLFVQTVAGERTALAEFTLAEDGEETAVGLAAATIDDHGAFSGISQAGALAVSFHGTLRPGSPSLSLAFEIAGQAPFEQVIGRVERQVFTGTYWTRIASPADPGGAPEFLVRADVSAGSDGPQVRVAFTEFSTGEIFESREAPIVAGVARSTARNPGEFDLTCAWNELGRLDLVAVRPYGNSTRGPWHVGAAIAPPIQLGRYRSGPVMVSAVGHSLVPGVDLFVTRNGYRAIMTLQDPSSGTELRSFANEVAFGGRFEWKWYLGGWSGVVRGHVPFDGSALPLDWSSGEHMDLERTDWHYCMSEALGATSERGPFSRYTDLHFAPEIALQNRPSGTYATVSYDANLPVGSGRARMVSPPILVSRGEFSGEARDPAAPEFGVVAFAGEVRWDGEAVLVDQTFHRDVETSLSDAAGRMRVRRAGGDRTVLYRGAPAIDFGRGATRTPFVFVHPDRGQPTFRAVTTTIVLAERSVREGGPARQLRTASQTTPLVADRAFFDSKFRHSDNREFDILQGCVSAEGVDLWASLSDENDDGVDLIRAFLATAPPAKPPTAGEYPVSRMVDRTSGDPDLGDIWHLELAVISATTVRLRYVAAGGSAVAVTPLSDGADPTFSGFVRIGTYPSALDVAFDGVFAPLPDVAGEPNAGNFPIVSHVVTPTRALSFAGRLDDATGEQGVIWLPVGEGSQIESATYSTAAAAAAALAHLNADEGVEAADFDRWGPAAATAPPNDPGFQADPLARMQMCCSDTTGPYRIPHDAWELEAEGGADVVYAVVDSGIHRHRDLQGRLLDQLSFYPVPRGVRRTPLDPANHGTKVAGLIAALRNNERAIAGASERSIVLPIQVSDGTGYAGSRAIGQAIEAARTWRDDERVVGVLNLSFGRAPNKVVAEEIRRAIEAGIVVVASAGNCEGRDGRSVDCDGTVQVTFPAGMGGEVSVGASKPASLDDAQSPSVVERYSHFGKNLDLFAPGSGVGRLSVLTNDGGTGESVGTSLAAPYVSATAGMILANWPLLRRLPPPNAGCLLSERGKECVDLVIARLQQSALAFRPEFDVYRQRGIERVGLVQALAALGLEEEQAIPPPIPAILRMEGCDGVEICREDGVAIEFESVEPAAELELDVVGYIVYVDGDPRRAMTTNDLPTLPHHSGHFAYEDRPKTTRVEGRERVADARLHYALSALYRHRPTGIFRESMVSDTRVVVCSSARERCQPVR